MASNIFYDICVATIKNDFRLQNIFVNKQCDAAHKKEQLRENTKNTKNTNKLVIFAKIIKKSLKISQEKTIC